MTARRCIRLTLAAVVVVAAVVAAGAAAHNTSPGRWSAPQALASITQYVSSSSLVVNQSGRAVAAWFSGRPQKVSAGSGGLVPARAFAAHGVKVFADVGSARRGFGAPVVVATNGDDEQGDVHAAVSGSGVAYVAWDGDSPVGWRIAVADGGRFSAPRSLGLPGGAQLIELASADSGPVDAVWIRYHVHAAPALYYATLRSDGSLGRTITVAHLGSPLTQIEFALDDRGAVVASWVLGPQGLNPARPRALTRVRAVLCTGGGSCGSPQTLPLGPVRPQLVNTATTLSDNGTATVLAGGEEEAVLDGGNVPTEIGPHGLWAAISRDGDRFRATPEISPTGNFPLAAAAGTGGAVAIFNVGAPPIDTIAWSGLTNAAAGFTPAQEIPDHETISYQALAANRAGAFVAAWLDNDRSADARNSLHAAIGSSGRLQAPQTIAPTADPPAQESLAAGIDGHGNAIVLWSEYGADGYTHGVFVSFARPMTP